jgi:hypothetical protein
MMAGAPFGPNGQWSKAWTGGTGSSLTNNVFVDKYGTSDWLLAGNWFPRTFGEVGFVGSVPGSLTPTDYALTALSPYKGKATDGKDPGADVAAVLAATNGVVR